ncbi:MAG: hypothetical protein K0S45_3202 [Nitrospira sp.]|jgi:hypothetical protein|nr:hypothetical protein [Nitrospira sp.]
MVVNDDKYERAFRILATEMFSLWLKLHVLSNIVEAHLPQEEKGLVDKSSANYLRSHGDQSLIGFFDHLRQMANRDQSAQDAPHETLDALWSEFETMRVQHSQDVAEREWRRLWGAL